MCQPLIPPIPHNVPHPDKGWLDLARLAVVEVTSEDKDYPVESALAAEKVRGWRAADVGNQIIRLIFDQPQKLKRITLLFEEMCASSGISAPLQQHTRSRNIGLNSPMSRFLNSSLCPTSVEDRLAPRS